MAAEGHVLVDLVIVLGVAALTSVLFAALRLPVVLGYLLAGLLIGPYVPLPLVGNFELVHTLSELGVILLMFSIGLEFSMRKIARLGASAFMTALVEVGLMVGLGYLAGRLLGWTANESLFLGVCVGISSTMLVAKAFGDRRQDSSLTEIVFAILVFEDLIAIVLLAVLTGVAGGRGLDAAELASLVGRLTGFLAALLVAGLLIVPRFVRIVVRHGRPETLLLASIGVCFVMSLAAEKAGYSVALGAFLAGLVVSESGENARVEHVIEPFKDLFSAVFFVAIGMSIDPRMVWAHIGPILGLTVLVMLGKPLGVGLGVFLAGHGLRRSIHAGLSLAQIGELSFIVAGLGVGSGAARDFLLPVAVGVSCLTSLTTPMLVGRGDAIAGFVDRSLPGRVQTFVSFYSSWVNELRKGRGETLPSRGRRVVVLLLVDVALLGATVVGAAVFVDDWLAYAAGRLGLGEELARGLLIGTTTLVSAIFLFGALRMANRLAFLLAAQVVPPGARGKLDLGTAPRRALVMTFELAIVLVVGLPLVAVITPFVPTGAIVFGALVVAIGFAVWRSVANLHGHVRAGSELIVEALARQSGRAATSQPELDDVRAMLPGIPGLSPVELRAGSPAVGKTLGEINLRAETGATVLVIQRRGHEGGVLPTAGEVLRAGDVLALAGAEDAVTAARALLAG